MRAITHILLAACALAALSVSARAQDDSGSGWDAWALDGYNSLRSELYDIDGNTAASPWADGGLHTFNEFNVNASRQYSPYERLRASAFGVINGSEYRNIDDGFVPERLNISYENGADGVPYRVEAGDFYAGISYRTLQRSLKGASLELQPMSSRERRHSILLFSGTNQPTYRSFDADDDFYSGLSWLIEDRNLGRLSFNAVHAYQDETTFMLPGSNNSQMLYSTAFETPFQLAAQDLKLEGELSFFEGDWGLLKGQNDTGSFGQLSGRSQGMPLDYRFRFERYGTDYRPNGAIIAPDRRSYEAHAGWRFEQGAYLRGRAQRYDDSFDSTNRVRTDLLGANLSGPLLTDWITGLTTNIDVYQQQMDDEFGFLNRDTDTLNAGFNMPLFADYSGQVTLFAQDTDDQLISNLDSNTKQLGLGIYTPIAWGSFSGTINPGIALRTMDMKGSADSREIHPTLNLTLANEAHRLYANYGFLQQNRISAGAPDVATQTAGFEYAYTQDIHELGFNGSYYDRDVDAALDTDAWKLGVYWTVRFNRPAGGAGYSPTTTASMADDGMTAPGLSVAGLSMLTQLQPGELVSRADALLAEQGISSPVERSGVKSYEATLLDEVIERQRVVIEHSAGRVKKSALVIDLTDTGSPRSVQQLYERTKQTLVRQYGKPSNIFEQGEFTTDVAGDINAERVIRVVEWETDGGTLRYGIPRRVDGMVRLELQHASSFASPRNTLWSVNLY